MEEKRKQQDGAVLDSDYESRLSVEQSYDSALSAMVTKLTEFVIPLVNEVFGERFTQNARVEIKNNKHIVSDSKGSLIRKDPDIFIELSEMIEAMISKLYHFECETWFDNNIFLRVAEYSSVIATENYEITKEGIVLKYPNSAVIFLRPNDGIPSAFKVTHCLPNGVEASYYAPTLQVRDYTVDDIFEKKLLILIPFYLFRFANELEEMEKDAEKRKGLNDALSDISARLEELVDNKEISVYQQRATLELLQRVSDKLTDKYKEVRKGVDTIMSGYIARTDADVILEQGQEETLGLMRFLWSSGRSEEAERATTDHELFRKLMSEYRANNLATTSKG